jgi:hypothetical protein
VETDLAVRHLDDQECWDRVAVTGVTERLDSQVDIDAAERLPVADIPTLTSRWVRIRPSAVSGRAFRRVPVPTGA